MVYFRFDLLLFISVAVLVCPSKIWGLPITHNARDGGDASGGVRNTNSGLHDIPKPVNTFPIAADSSPNLRRYFDPDDIGDQDIWRKDTDVRDVTRLNLRKIQHLESRARDHIAITIHDPVDAGIHSHVSTTSSSESTTSSHFMINNHGSLTVHNHGYVPGQHYTINNHGSLEIHNHGSGVYASQLDKGKGPADEAGQESNKAVGGKPMPPVKQWVPKAAGQAMIKSVVGIGVKGAVGWGSSLADCAVSVARACIDHYANNGHGGHDKSD